MQTPFTKLVSAFNKIYNIDFVGAEIGVRYGANAVNMLQNIKLKKLYLVDSFEEYVDNDGMRFTQEVQDAEFLVMKINISGYPIAEIIKKSSEEAIKTFEDESLDFVYIDGAHDYKNVKKDLEWGKKVKHGGIIGGHDYDPLSIEVIQAVNEYIIENEYKIIVLEPRDGDKNGVEWAIIKT